MTFSIKVLRILTSTSSSSVLTSSTLHLLTLYSSNHPPAPIFSVVKHKILLTFCHSCLAPSGLRSSKSVSVTLMISCLDLSIITIYFKLFCQHSVSNLSALSELMIHVTEGGIKQFVLFDIRPAPETSDRLQV